MKMTTSRWVALCGLLLCLGAVNAKVAYSDDNCSALAKIKEEYLGAEPSVRLLIHRDVPNLLLEVSGKYKVKDPANGQTLSSGNSKKFLVRGVEDGIAWGEEYPGVFQFEVVPCTAETSIFINGIQYHGAVAIYHVDNKLFAVNELLVEDYLHSVLPSFLEGGPTGEALAAAAILARTDILSRVIAHPNAVWHVDARPTGYLGCATAYQDPELDQFIEQTRGIVMVAGASHMPFRCRWDDVPTAPLRSDQLFGMGISDPVAGASAARTEWSCSMPKSELAQLAHLNAVKQVTVCMSQDSGDVHSLTVTDGAQTAAIPVKALRDRLGERKLRSNHFQINLVNEHIRFAGQATASGLDLFAAQDLAEQGRDATAILKTFFPNARLQPWGE